MISLQFKRAETVRLVPHQRNSDVVKDGEGGNKCSDMLDVFFQRIVRRSRLGSLHYDTRAVIGEL